MTLTWDEAVANAYMTAGDAKTESRGYIQVFSDTRDTVIINSYDDYIFLSQQVQSNVSLGGTYYFPKKDFKEIFSGDTLEQFDAEAYMASHGVDEVFESLSDLLDEPLISIPGFAFAPDRFTKLGRLKPAGRLEVTFHDDQGYKFAKFKTESLEGLMTLLENETEDVTDVPNPFGS